MNVCAGNFINYLKERDFTFNVKEKEGTDTTVTFPYQGKMTSFAFTGDDGCYVSIHTVYENVPEEKFADLLIVCNELNTEYRWLKFYVDTDNDLMVEDDAILEPETAADECFELLVRRINILDDVKPRIMRAIYA